MKHPNIHSLALGEVFLAESGQLATCCDQSPIIGLMEEQRVLGRSKFLKEARYKCLVICALENNFIGAELRFVGAVPGRFLT